jgi:hypothetical protein
VDNFLLEAFEPKILAMKEAEKTDREIDKYFEVGDKYVVKQFISRFHRK